MKKIPIIVLLLSLTQLAFAQENDNTFNVRIGAHGGGLGFGGAFDVAVANDFTIGLIHETMTLSSGSVTATTTGFGIGARYYFNGALQQGAYLNPYFMIGGAEGSSTSQSVEAEVSSFGALFGHHWMGKNFNADLGIGARSISTGEITATGGVDTTSLEETLNQVGLSLSFSVGYAF